MSLKTAYKSPYHIFREEKRNEINVLHPDLSEEKIFEILLTMWDSLRDSEKIVSSLSIHDISGLIFIM